MLKTPAVIAPATELPAAFVPDGTDAAKLRMLRPRDFAAWLEGRSPGARRWVRRCGFTAAPHTALLVPEARGVTALAGLGDLCAEDPLTYALLPRALPAATYRLADELSPAAARAVALGWLFGSYRYAPYKREAAAGPPLVWPGQACGHAAALAAAEWDARDWINSPSSDLGPEALATLVASELEVRGAVVKTLDAAQLAAVGLNGIAAVGRGSARPPVLIEASWGRAGAPRLVLVGKGVCFDAGGLNSKPFRDARHMKADMAGAAHALALARLVAVAQLDVELTLLIPAVDNVPSGSAMRNGDVIRLCDGRSVEIGHTDYEGRILVADAIAWAARLQPDLVIDFTTLTDTGLGPEIAGFFANDDGTAAALQEAATRMRDPVWRLPLWRRYAELNHSAVADVSNIERAAAPVASLAAALFLEAVVGDTPWLHFDVDGWNELPGKPEGGNVAGLRACFAFIAARYPAL